MDVEMVVSGIQIEVERKRIKHTHLAVYPPDARVHVSAPEDLPERDIRSYVASKIGWIREQRKAILSQARQTPREYVDGESIYCLGRRYRLTVIEEDGGATEKILWGGGKLVLYVHEGSTRERKKGIVESWQKSLLGECLAGKIGRWCKKLGREAPHVELRKMKTRWASCLADKGKIIFNAALARVPSKCVEYVVVHELTHFEVRNHSEAFVRLMDERLPRWRELRKELNGFISAPMEEA